MFQGCIIVKNDGGDDTPVVLNLSPKPEIPMSDELVRSKKGDMIALLPQGWHYLNVEEDASSDIIAVAVNPDYNLSAVFSTIRNSDELDEVVTREGLLGLARQSLANHAKKTAGAVKQVGKYSTINMGSQSFAQYEFSNGSPLITKAVVFISSIDEYYEFALIPMNVSGKPLPSQPEIDKIFRSILTTVQY
ncbi:MAG TPA: hypothetical protein VHP30_14530 [Ignavibacteriales bacterium]|nr:hypothetical protein [Ignavibacteriales bacterium]